MSDHQPPTWLDVFRSATESLAVAEDVRSDDEPPDTFVPGEITLATVVGPCTFTVTVHGPHTQTPNRPS